MKDSEYFEKQVKIHTAAAENPTFEPWVREANRVLAIKLNYLRLQALEDENHEIPCQPAPVAP